MNTKDISNNFNNIKEENIIEKENVKQLLNYMREVAEIVGIKTETGTNILSNQYEKIKFYTNMELNY